MCGAVLLCDLLAGRRSPAGAGSQPPWWPADRGVSPCRIVLVVPEGGSAESAGNRAEPERQQCEPSKASDTRSSLRASREISARGAQDRVGRSWATLLRG